MYSLVVVVVVVVSGVVVVSLYTYPRVLI